MSDLIYNKKATFNYEIGETLLAGIELLGFEVKALRAGHGSLDGAYVTVRTEGGAGRGGNGGKKGSGKPEAFLVGAQISPLQPGNTPKEYEERRDRRLLLTRTEINLLSGQKSRAGTSSGLTAVPISVYNVGRKIKVKIGLARSKKKFDKRETIKKRDVDRDVRRELRHRS